MTETAEVAKTWEQAAEPKFVKLGPDTVMNAACGRPVGTVELLGRTLSVRCATIGDAEEVRGMRADDANSNTDRFIRIAAMALSENDSPPTAAQLRKLRLADAGKINEVVGCFLWEGAHSGS